MFIDSHAHLDSSAYDADRPAVVERARSAGVSRVLAIGSGTGPGTLDCAIRLAEAFEGLDASVGIHPHESVLATEEDFILLPRLAENSSVVAWGEIGLDFHYDHSPREVQREVFARQLRLAAERQLPVIIHTRESEVETLKILQENWNSSEVGGILHCYSGSHEFAQAGLEMGFLISFSGMLTFPKAQAIREVALRVPEDRLLIETDAPFLAPVPYRGKRNEPAFVVQTAKALAELKGVSVETIARQTSENYCRLFHLASC
ncbi:MAG: TatD family deoxyribonuclease [Acidimicrobiia bacterium]|nr:TatD family deoxyribonuclease [Acidimicrobiia bacterium]